MSRKSFTNVPRVLSVNFVIPLGYNVRLYYFEEIHGRLKTAIVQMYLPCNDPSSILHKFISDHITKHAYSNTVTSSPPKTESFQIKILIFLIYLLKT